jgi:hypothetical protein
MFSKVALLIAATMAVFVAASPIPGGEASQCNTGAVQCCQQVHQSNTAEASFLASLVGVSLEGITGSVGAQCSPLTGLGVGGGAQWYVSLYNEEVAVLIFEM